MGLRGTLKIALAKGWGALSVFVSIQETVDCMRLILPDVEATSKISARGGFSGFENHDYRWLRATFSRGRMTPRRTLR